MTLPTLLAGQLIMAVLLTMWAMATLLQHRLEAARALGTIRDLAHGTLMSRTEDLDRRAISGFALYAWPIRLTSSVYISHV